MTAAGTTYLTLRPPHRTFLVWAVLVLVLTSLAVGVIGVTSWVLNVAADAPSLASCKHAERHGNSVIYAADGERLGAIVSPEASAPVAQKRIPRKLELATVAIEDQRFFQHGGLDTQGILRAAITDIEADKTGSAQGRWQDFKVATDLVIESPLVGAGLGNDAIVRAHDASIEVATADWGGTFDLGRGAGVHLVPVHHWSARGVGDRNRALWAGFVLEGVGGGGTVFFAGDTGFDGGRPFRRVAGRHGPPDLALLPIGAYEPRWFMSEQHMNPEESVKAFRDCGAELALGHHYGTLQLTDEPIDAPVTALAGERVAAGIAPERFRVLQPGEVWTL